MWRRAGRCPVEAAARRPSGLLDLGAALPAQTGALEAAGKKRLDDDAVEFPSTFSVLVEQRHVEMLDKCESVSAVSFPNAEKRGQNEVLVS